MGRIASNLSNRDLNFIGPSEIGINRVYFGLDLRVSTCFALCEAI